MVGLMSSDEGVHVPPGQINVIIPSPFVLCFAVIPTEIEDGVPIRLLPAFWKPFGS